ncbi:GIY-YIG nuclease family protein [Flavobacterium amnicola]|uniref:GIY-YIG nuclease family protein n=1 Tax=Flavobacterium amnicola TaxID=2506422 RepID=A0A4Q1K664_9FLAO|nr:GIY-YIG nuclease family protein [Flavobacterium amnicola]
MFYTYILYSKIKDVYYKGFTSNLESRLQKHNSGESNYTASVNDWEIVYSCTFDSKTEALKEEKRLKKLNRLSLEKLISSKNNP